MQASTLQHLGMTQRAPRVDMPTEQQGRSFSEDRLADARVLCSPCVPVKGLGACCTQ